LELYSETAKHYSPKLKIKHPETNGFIEGKSQLRTWWNDAFINIPTLHYSVTNLIANNEMVFMEYIRKVAGELDLNVGEVLHIKEGKIISSKVYHG